ACIWRSTDALSPSTSFMVNLRARPIMEDSKLASIPETFPTSGEPVTGEYERLEDVGYMTSMTLVLLGNYAQTGHFGGPLAYTPYNVAIHLIGPGLGGLRYDYRRPKHPYGDKFMLAGG